MNKPSKTAFVSLKKLDTLLPERICPFMFLKFGVRVLLTVSIVLWISLAAPILAQKTATKYPNYTHLRLEKSDGYKLDQVNAMLFDEEGWLWMSGIRNVAQNFTLGERDLLIQRFNGQTFYDIAIPDEVIHDATNITLQKFLDGSFLVKVGAKEKSRLYRLDPRRITFEEIPLPNTTATKSPKFELFILEGRVLLVQENSQGNELYLMDPNSELFRLVGRMKTSKSIVNCFAVAIDDQLWISRYNIGTECFRWEGDQLVQQEISSSSGISNTSIIETASSYKGSIYITCNRDPKVYTYDSLVQHFVEANSFDNNPSVGGHFMMQDGKENSVFILGNGNYGQFQIYKDPNESPIWIHDLGEKILTRPFYASRDLTKEFIFNSDQYLEIYTFDDGVVQSFLDDMSLRSMLQYDDDQVLVATEFDGWYLLDLRDNRIEPFLVKYQNNRFRPLLNRDIYIADRQIWSNNGQSLISVDYTTRQTAFYRSQNGIEALAQDKKKVVFSDDLGALKTFDRQSETFTTLIEQDSIIYEDLHLHEATILAATSHGLKYVASDQVEIFEPSPEDTYIISLAPFTKNSILLGTKSGTLYSFDLQTKSFDLLYKDDLSASIASILLDDAGRIWLNTFAGIIAFDPITKVTQRFGINEGLSHYEANRLSHLKLKDGRLLVGTVRGLNLFHPDSLLNSISVKPLDHNLQWVSIEKFDPETQEVAVLLDRNELDQVQKITLPARNRNVLLHFGIIKPSLNISYAYRYSLNQSDWINVPNQDEIRLQNLESGQYDLEIQALDKSKNEVLSTLELKIEVEQFFYESIWFYLTVLLTTLLALSIYSFKRNQVNMANYKNRLLKAELDFKKKDLADFASNISRNQQWNNYILSKMAEIKEAKGRKKGAAFVNLEKEIEEKNNVIANNFEFQKRIDVLSNEFYNTLLKQFPGLSKTEIKLCSLIRLDLDNHDIATLQNIDISSVYKSRYRLRKKLNITSDTDLDAFLKAF